MSLKKYYNQVVLVEPINGNNFIGIVEDYFEPDDNESGTESIIIKKSDDSLTEIYPQDIDKITVL